MVRTNGKLLNDNQSTSLLSLCNLCQVHRNLRRCDAYGETVEEATNNQHCNSIASRLESRSNHPGYTRKSYRVTSSDPVGNETSYKRSQNRSSSQSRVDTSLHYSSRVVEVVDVLLGADLGRHGRDVKTKQRAAQCRDKRNKPRVVDPGKLFPEYRHCCGSLEDIKGQKVRVGLQKMCAEWEQHP